MMILLTRCVNSQTLPNTINALSLPKQNRTQPFVIVSND